MPDIKLPGAGRLPVKELFWQTNHHSHDQWGLQPSSWSQFHVLLKSSARLVSVQDAKEIWYDTCTSEKIDGERDPKLEDLKTKDGELLKTMLKEAADTCTDELWKNYKWSLSRNKT